MNAFFFKKYLDEVLSYERPSRYSLTKGLEKSHKFAYLYFILDTNETEETVLIESFDGVKVNGFVVPVIGDDKQARSFSLEQAMELRTEVIFVYLDHEFKCDSLSEFYWFIALKRHKISRVVTKTKRALYAYYTPNLKDRTELLSILVEEYLLAENHHQGLSAFAVVQKLNGKWIFFSSKYKPTLRRIELVLDSLVSSGELSVEAGIYTIEPKAIETLTEFESDNRRHLDNVSHNRRIFWLTAILAIVGIFQIPIIQRILGLV
jgi:hypothetical protein